MRIPAIELIEIGAGGGSIARLDDLGLLPAIEWLEGEIKSSRCALVLISHDRRFLERLSRATVWLDRGKTRRLSVRPLGQRRILAGRTEFGQHGGIQLRSTRQPTRSQQRLILEKKRQIGTSHCTVIVRGGTLGDANRRNAQLIA